MRAIRSNILRSFLAALIGLCGMMGAGVSPVRAADEGRSPLAVQFSLDRPLDAAAAPFVMAATGGLFTAEGLSLTTNVAAGSPDAIAGVAAGRSELPPRALTPQMR